MGSGSRPERGYHPSSPGGFPPGEGAGQNSTGGGTASGSHQSGSGSTSGCRCWRWARSSSGLGARYAQYGQGSPSGTLRSSRKARSRRAPSAWYYPASGLSYPHGPPRRLSDAADTGLAAASVQGRDFDLDVVAGVTGLPPDEVLDSWRRPWTPGWWPAGPVPVRARPGPRGAVRGAAVPGTAAAARPGGRGPGRAPRGRLRRLPGRAGPSLLPGGPSGPGRPGRRLRQAGRRPGDEGPGLRGGRRSLPAGAARPGAPGPARRGRTLRAAAGAGRGPDGRRRARRRPGPTTGGRRRGPGGWATLSRWRPCSTSTTWPPGGPTTSGNAWPWPPRWCSWPRPATG